MTTAILTNMIIEEKWEEIFKYKFIAIDEVHEMNDPMI
jgi:HrpA-like RNA helicase